MKNKKLKDIDRDHLIAQARLHSLCMVLSNLCFEVTERDWPQWSGNINQGHFYFDNGSGDVLAMTWNRELLSLGVYDHESERNNINDDWPKNQAGDSPQSDPSYFFPNFPEENKKLLKKCVELMDSNTGDTNITATLWCNQKETYCPEPLSTAKKNGLWMIENYFLSPRDALIDKNAKIIEGQKDFYFSAVVGDIGGGLQSNGWKDQYGLSKEQVQLSLELAPKLVNEWNLTLSSEQWKAFKTIEKDTVGSFTGNPKKIIKDNLVKAKNLLTSMGINTLP